MATTLTREQILARKTTSRKTEPFVLPDGSVILIRGMTHGQAFDARQDDPAERYDMMIHFGVAQPALDVSDAHEWRVNEDAGVIESLVGRIMEMSGLSEGAGKSGVPGA
jgi:hypothetical protein